MLILSILDSCKLGCFIANTGHGYDFGNVEDGTNCDQLDGSVISDKCINGECVVIIKLLLINFSKFRL